MRKSSWKRIVVILAVLLLGAGTAGYVVARVPSEESGMSGEADKGITDQAAAEGQETGEDRTADEPETGAEQTADGAGNGIATSGGAQSGSDEDPVQAFHVTVLGDSIAKGYSGDKTVEIECYGSLAAQKISGEAGIPYSYQNFAKNGLDSSGMNEKILPQREVQESIASADVIFITLGSNDLLNECKRVVQEILDTDTKFKSADDALAVLEDAVKENPFLILKIINALSNWDYLSFEEQWTAMMDTVCSLKKEDARIIVTNIYNPVADLKLPSTMNQVVEDIIGNMNSFIDDHAAEYVYAVADLFDSEISEHVQSDGLHPDQYGQQLIADIVCDQYKTLSQE